MNAIPGESGTSASPVLHLICSAEKLPSIMKVRMSSFLQSQSDKQRGMFERWLTQSIVPSNRLEG